MSQQLANKMRATSEAFVKSFDGDWQAGATMEYRAPECIHTIFPSALNIPKRTNEQWAEFFKGVAPLITDAKMIVEDYLGVPSECRSVCRSSMTAKTAVGPYSCDYVWFFDFNDSGDQIVNITEMMDSQSAGNLLTKLADAGLIARRH